MVLAPYDYSSLSAILGASYGHRNIVKVLVALY